MKYNLIAIALVGSAIVYLSSTAGTAFNKCQERYSAATCIHTLK